MVNNQTNNICKFIPSYSSKEALTVINFVYEREADFPQKYVTLATYSLNIVTVGLGVLHTLQGKYPLKVGDIFFTFQAKQFYIENVDNLQYMYVTFLGLRSNSLLERLQVKMTSPVYNGYGHLIDFWNNAMELSNPNNIDLLSESVLLYTFSFICNAFVGGKVNKQFSNIILEIKKHIDDNYFDTELSLKSVSKLFSYNPKYISAQFKKTVKIGFNDYLRTIRLEHACLLMKDRYKNIKEIAHFSGFKDPLYFSKVFKNEYKVSPREYIRVCQGTVL